MENEEWRDIPGYEGQYKISDLGRVKSIKNGVERILKLNPDSHGYATVAPSINNNQKQILVHQTMAIVFLGHVPCGLKAVVDHIDNNKLNNSLTNIQIISARENVSKDRIGGSSSFLGVYFNKKNNRFHSAISIDGKQLFIGCYKEEIDASNAYLKALHLLNSEGKNAVREFAMEKRMERRSSKYKGVSYKPFQNCWQARITAFGKRNHIGYFKYEEDAHRAVINFIENGSKI